MASNCVICDNKLTGPICLFCLEGLQEQVLEGARLIALLSSTVLDLTKRLVKIESTRPLSRKVSILGMN